MNKVWVCQDTSVRTRCGCVKVGACEQGVDVSRYERVNNGCVKVQSCEQGVGVSG